jgi:fatty-acyl-CoA synthase
MTAPARSYTNGLSATPLLHQTIGETLDLAAQRWPDQEAVVVRDRNVRLSFAELRQEADRVAAGFVALDLKHGERIGIWSPNRIEWILTQFAAAKAGLILVNINPAYRLAELEYALNKVQCRGLVTADRFRTSNYIGMLRALAPELAVCAPGSLRSERLPHLTSVIHMDPTDEPGFYRFDAIAGLGGVDEHARLAELADLVQPDDAANIQFTSGTTGTPKRRRSRTTTSSTTRCFRPRLWASSRATGCAIRCHFIIAAGRYAAAFWALCKGYPPFGWAKPLTRQRCWRRYRRSGVLRSWACRRCLSRR